MRTIDGNILEVGVMDLKPIHRAFRKDYVTLDMLGKKAREAATTATSVWFVPDPKSWLGQVRVTANGHQALR